MPLCAHHVQRLLDADARAAHRLHRHIDAFAVRQLVDDPTGSSSFALTHDVRAQLLGDVQFALHHVHGDHLGRAGFDRALQHDVARRSPPRSRRPCRPA